MTSIRETITDSLITIGVSVDEIENYNRYIDVAAGALQEREYEIVDKILSIAVGHYDVSESDVENVLTEAGLSVRPQPEPEPEVAVAPEGEPTEPGNVEERVSKLEQGQAQILQAIQGLTTLAQRHLGSSSL